MTRLSQWLMGTGMALVLVTTAPAAQIIGSFTLAGLGVVVNGSNPLTDTTIVTTTSDVTTSDGTGDYAPILSGTIFTASALDLSSLTSYTLTSSFGTFTTTSGTVIQHLPGFLEVILDGTFTPGAGLAAGLDPSPTSVRISVNFSGGSASEGLSLVSPPETITSTPEPATLALIGGGLILGAAFLRRRRA